MKSLSEKLCESADIKPVYGLYINFGDLDCNYKLVTSKSKYELIAEYRYNVDSEDELKYLTPTYLPNFETNKENFVKLLEIMHEFEIIKDLINIGSYVETILVKARQVAGYHKVFARALQDEEWDYNE